GDPPKRERCLPPQCGLARVVRRVTTAATTRRRRTMTQGLSPLRRTAGFVHPAAHWTASPSRGVLRQLPGQHATLHGSLRPPMTRRRAPEVRPLARRLPPPPPHPETLSRLQ